MGKPRSTNLFNKLLSEMAAMREGQAAMRESNGKIFSEMAAMRESNGKIFSEMAAMRESNGKIFSEMAAMRESNDWMLFELLDLKQYVNENMFTRSEAVEMEDRMLTHVDGFIKLHETLDVELAALRSRCERIEARFDP